MSYAMFIPIFSCHFTSHAISHLHACFLDDTCRVCGAAGHFARSCPTERSRQEKERTERMQATQCFKVRNT
jgi:hypothetical protein